MFAGLVVGGWELRDPFAPAAMPAPGVYEAQVPLAWYDSAAVVTGEGAAWKGFGAGLATATGILDPPHTEHPRAVFTAWSGAHGIDRNGVLITHGDPGTWLRVGAIAGKRGSVGALGASGDHEWTVIGSRRLGMHTFDASFAQRGVGELQTLGYGESARGRAGSLGWGWAQGRDSLSARYSVGFDVRSSGISGLEAGSTPVMTSRDARERTFEAGLARRDGGREWALHFVRADARVGEGFAYADGFTTRAAWTTSTSWLAARHRRPLGEGELELVLGAGHDPTIAVKRDRDVLAPAVSWRVDQGAQRVRVFLERVVDPVWSDLDADFRPFLQHTWTGGFAAEGGRGGPVRGGVQVLAGRTANRATAFRTPIAAQSLGVGYRADAHRYNFLLLQSSLAASWRALLVDASGFALARGRTSEQPRVDPALGGVAGLGTAFRLFAGDLGVRLRAQAAYVGVRETDTRVLDVTGSPVETVLPGYATYSATATFLLGDATVVLRGDALEGERHPLTWIDYATLTYALDSGRQFRAEVVWPLFN